jgi:hypothetical protein
VASERRIEVVRGRMDESASDELLAFWTERGTGGGDVERRLAEAVLVLRGGDGRIAGASGVAAERIPFVAGREFWVYRTALEPGVPLDWFMPMLAATFDALAEERAATGTGPAGVFLSLGSRELIERHREFVWPEPRFMYVGYLAEGGQARLRYFEGARI